MKGGGVLLDVGLGLRLSARCLLVLGAFPLPGIPLILR